MGSLPAYQELPWSLRGRPLLQLPAPPPLRTLTSLYSLPRRSEGDPSGKKKENNIQKKKERKKSTEQTPNTNTSRESAAVQARPANQSEEEAGAARLRGGAMCCSDVGRGSHRRLVFAFFNFRLLAHAILKTVD